MSWKFEVHGCGDPAGHYVSNQSRFATREEADSYGFDLGMRWFGFDDGRIVESSDPVNARWDRKRGLVWESEEEGPA